MNGIKSTQFKKIVSFIGCAIIFLGLTPVPYAKAQSGSGDGQDRFKVESVIMLLNLDESYIVVAEKTMKIIQTSTGGSGNTALYDINNKPVNLSDFKLGQLVLVQGRINEKGELIATSIQMRPERVKKTKALN